MAETPDVPKWEAAVEVPPLQTALNGRPGAVVVGGEKESKQVSRGRVER